MRTSCKVLLPFRVFPSLEKTLTVERTKTITDSGIVYSGRHYYELKNCLGVNDGETRYSDEYQSIQFIQKLDDGTIIPGIQAEQLAYVLLDRTIKFHAESRSEYEDKMIQGLKMFLEACQERIENRAQRGAMDENLKNNIGDYYE